LSQTDQDLRKEYITGLQQALLSDLHPLSVPVLARVKEVTSKEDNDEIEMVISIRYYDQGSLSVDELKDGILGDPIYGYVILVV